MTTGAEYKILDKRWDKMNNDLQSMKASVMVIQAKQDTILSEWKELKDMICLKADQKDLDAYMEKTEQLWDWKNKVLGWTTAAAGAVSFAMTVVVPLIRDLFNK